MKLGIKNLIISLFIISSEGGKCQDLTGHWESCIGIDSVKTFQCEKGYTSYYVSKTGKFILGDTSICYDSKFQTTGNWVITGNRFTINHDAYKNEFCSGSGWSKSHTITWINKDLFYSVSIGRVDWEGERIYSVFRRVK